VAPAIFCPLERIPAKETKQTMVRCKPKLGNTKRANVKTHNKLIHQSIDFEREKFGLGNDWNGK
jgi:hypothetical protein